MNDILNLEKSVSSQRGKIPTKKTDSGSDYKDTAAYIVSRALYNKKYSMNGGNSNGI